MDLTVKTYEEMAKDVFFARDEYEKMKKKQKKLAVRICAAALVLSVGAGAVFAAACPAVFSPASVSMASSSSDASSSEKRETV